MSTALPEPACLNWPAGFLFISVMSYLNETLAPYVDEEAATPI